MKLTKFMCVMLSGIVFCGFISGCKIKKAEDVIDSDSSSVEVDGSDETEESQLYYDIGDEVETEDFTFCVNSIKNFHDADYFYVVCDVTYTNNTDASVYVSIGDSISGYLDNQKAIEQNYVDYPWVVDNNLLFRSISINPGRSFNGLIVYLSYKEWNRVEIQCGDVIVAAEIDDTEYIELFPNTTETTIVSETEATTPTPTPTTEPVIPSETTMGYIVDVQSRTFHIPFCDELMNVPVENQITIEGNHSSMVNDEYVPCEVCGS